MSGFSASAFAGLTIYLAVFALVCLLLSLVTRFWFQGAALVAVTVLLTVALLLFVVAATTPIVDFRLGVVMSYLCSIGLIVAVGWLALLRIGAKRG